MAEILTVNNKAGYRSSWLKLKFFCSLEIAISISLLIFDKTNLSFSQELLQPALLVTSNISTIFQPIELKIFLVTLQSVGNNNIQTIKILSSSQKLLQPALLVTANTSAISESTTKCNWDKIQMPQNATPKCNCDKMQF